MIQTTTYKNGLTVVTEEMPAFHSVSLGIWVKAGVFDELAHEAGLAHFVEHLVFKGTTTKSAKELAEQFDQLGADCNAFTSKELTCFFVTALTEYAPKVFRLLAEIIESPALLPEEIKKEQAVILEELAEVLDTPDDEVHELLWERMYPTSAVGKPILGTEKSIMSFQKEQIVHFMKRLYRPDRMVVSLAGEISPELMREVQVFAERLTRVEDVQQEREMHALFYPAKCQREKAIEQAHLCLGYEALDAKNERKYELSLLDSIVGGGMSSRLFQQVREEKGLAYSVYSYYTSYEMTGAFICYAATSLEKVEELRETILTVMHKLATTGVTEQELQVAKQQVGSSFLLGLENTESRMYRNGHQQLLGETIDSVEEVMQRIQGVTIESINQLAAELFSKEPAESLLVPAELADENDNCPPEV